MGGSAEEVSGAVGLAASAAAGLAASAAVDLDVSAVSVGASDVSAVVDSDVVSDSTVGMVRHGTAAMTMICLGMAIMIRRLSHPTSSSPIRPLSFRRRPRPMPKSYLTRTRECQAKNPTCCALANYC